MILSWHRLVARMLLGLRSRWITRLSWRNCNDHQHQEEEEEEEGINILELFLQPPVPVHQPTHLPQPKPPTINNTMLSTACLDSLEDLEHEVAVVDVVQRLVRLVDHVVEVAVQQFHHDVQLVVLPIYEQVLQRNDVRVRREVPARYAAVRGCCRA